MNRPTAYLVVALLIIVSGLAGVAAPREAHEPAPSLAVRGPLGAPEMASIGGRATNADGRAPGPEAAMPSAGAPASIPALPTPTGEVGSALSTGTAGIASWYDAKGDVAAVPWFRYGMDPIWASICTFPGMARCVSVLISDACQCYVGTPRERLIDLSRTAFAQLADPSVGVIRVTLEVPVQGARVTAPPTSVR